MRIREGRDRLVFLGMAYPMLATVSVVCLLPFWLIVSASLTDEQSIVRSGFGFWPQKFSLRGYETVFRFPGELLRAYWVTGITTVVGTALGLLLVSMAGYVLQRKDFRYRDAFSFLIYFTTLFGGGLVPWYIMLTKYFQLTDTYAVLIFPGLMNPFLIFLMRTFIRISVPEELLESAKIDGVGDFRFYRDIVLPLSLPGLATVGLLLALQYWNDWFLSALFINDKNMYQLQYYLYNLINKIQFISQMGVGTGVTLSEELPTESTKMAMAVVVTGPILLLYPFVQRYFVRGLTIGAVKS